MASCRKWILNIHSFTIWIKNEQLPVEHTFWWPILRKKFHEIFTLVWEAISKTRASGFIRRSKHLETIKALGRSGLVLSSVSQCLEPLIKPSHSWLIYYIKGSTCLLLNLWMAPCTLCFLEVNLPFNLTVTAKSSVPEQLERSPFWKACWRFGRLAWRHCATRPKRSGRQHQLQNGRMCRGWVFKTKCPEIPKDG